MASPAFTFGIEEEYFLVDRQTRRPLPLMPPAFHTAARAALGAAFGRELLQAQAELRTTICSDPAQGESELRRLRRGLGRIANDYGLGVVAAGTPPLAEWRLQRHTHKPRYDQLMDDLQMLGRRNLVCGLHVHVELPDPDARVDAMRRLQPWLPLLLALSTSSPFWRRRDTGLMSYRHTAYREIPRSGLPPLFRDHDDYQRYLAVLVEAGVLSDGSYLWWALRPSIKFPTLELRLTDACTWIEDALALTQLYRCLLRLLWRRPDLHDDLSAADQALIAENLWRAQRYGLDAGFLDPQARTVVPASTLLERTLALLAEDIAAFGAEAHIEQLRRILARGTSAHRQLALYRERRATGASRVQALEAVVDWLIETTVPPDREFSALPRDAAP